VRGLMENKKQAIIYYSLTGSTKVVAELIAKETGADLIEVEMKKPYTNFSAMTKGVFQVYTQSKPKIVNEIDVTDYDTVYIGTPVWCSTYVPPINTVIRNINFSDKEIFLFCTHKGGKGKTFKNFRNKLKDSKILGEKDFQDVSNNDPTKEVLDWINLVNVRKA
jgi:flavodoxin